MRFLALVSILFTSSVAAAATFDGRCNGSQLRAGCYHSKSCDDYAHPSGIPLWKRTTKTLRCTSSSYTCHCKFSELKGLNDEDYAQLEAILQKVGFHYNRETGEAVSTVTEPTSL